MNNQAETDSIWCNLHHLIIQATDESWFSGLTHEEIVNLNDEILEAMEKIAISPGGLRKIVEKYASCSSWLVLGNISYFVSRYEYIEKNADEIRQCIFLTIQQLQVNHPAIIVNLITAIQRLTMEHPLIQDNDPIPSYIGDFIINALKMELMVSSTALQLTSEIFNDKSIDHVFSKEQKLRLADALKKLSQSPKNMLKSELQYLKPLWE